MEWNEGRLWIFIIYYFLRKGKSDIYTHIHMYIYLIIYLMLYCEIYVIYLPIPCQYLDTMVPDISLQAKYFDSCIIQTLAWVLVVFASLWLYCTLSFSFFKFIRYTSVLGVWHSVKMSSPSSSLFYKFKLESFPLILQCIPFSCCPGGVLSCRLDSGLNFKQIVSRLVLGSNKIDFTGGHLDIFPPASKNFWSMSCSYRVFAYLFIGGRYIESGYVMYLTHGCY